MGANDDAARLRQLQLITDAALAHLQLDELLSALLARTRDALGVDTCVILLLDESRRELVARAAIGLEEEVERGVRIPVGQGFAGRVVAGRAPIVLPDVDDADVLNPLLREKGVKSLLGVPLIADGEVSGVMHVGTLRPHEFQAADVDLLQLAADRAAIAIEHARVFEAERQARMRLEHIQAVTDAALAHLELDELLAELLVRIREILSVDTCAILLLDDERDRLVARAAVGLEEEVDRGVVIPVGAGFAGRVAAEQRPVVLPDVEHADVVNPLLREKGVKSLLGVPLLVGGRTIGVLHVGSLVPRTFAQSEIELLQLVAERAALAIEKARVHEEIVRVDQLKLNFVAVASHELRTPATSVYGILATLRERGDDLPEQVRTELFETVWEEAVRLRRLTEQLLALARLDSDAIRIEPQPLVVRSLLMDVARSAVAYVDPRDVRIDAAEELAVVADRLALERVLSNLLVNAARHGRPPITLSAARRDRHFRIAVEDAGDGVPPEVLPRLFDRFERGLSAQGSGLGLAIAKAYARAHGGDLVYEPRQPNGARFELILPHG